MAFSYVAEITTLLMGLIGLIFTIAILSAHTWRVSSSSESAGSVSYITFQEGLWVRCTSVGKETVSRDTYWQCDKYEDAYVGVTTNLTAYRVLIILALFASCVGVAFSILAMQCTKLVHPRSRERRLLILAGGIGHLFAGVLIAITVIWYAAEVSRQKHSVYYQTQQVKYKLGPCIYLGFVAALLEIVCGGIMIVSMCLASTKAKNKFSYVRKDPPYMVGVNGGGGEVTLNKSTFNRDADGYI